MRVRKLITILFLIWPPAHILAQSTVTALIQQLASPNWADRADALDQILAIPNVLQQAVVQSALLTTLDNENGVQITSLRQSDGTQSIADILGEDYIDYVGRLATVVESFADLTSANNVRILAQDGGDPASDGAKKLASQCSLLVPILVDNSRSPVALIRLETVNWAMYILHVLKPPSLNSDGAAQLFQVLQAGLVDPDRTTSAFANTQMQNLSDVNSDGLVNCDDVVIVKTALGRKAGQAGFDARADVNFDGVVDIRDLAFVSQKLPAGTHCQ